MRVGKGKAVGIGRGAAAWSVATQAKDPVLKMGGDYLAQRGR